MKKYGIEKEAKISLAEGLTKFTLVFSRILGHTEVDAHLACGLKKKLPYSSKVSSTSVEFTQFVYMVVKVDSSCLRTLRALRFTWRVGKASALATSDVVKTMSFEMRFMMLVLRSVNEMRVSANCS
jgi:hypothetical protein